MAKHRDAPLAAAIKREARYRRGPKRLCLRILEGDETQLTSYADAERNDDEGRLACMLASWRPGESREPRLTPVRVEMPRSVG